MIETKAMAYINLYGVLAALENLCELDAEAKAILATLKKPVSLCFSVGDGPCGTLHFTKDGCCFTEGSAGCTCKMKFSSPAAFNNLIDNSKPGLPTKRPIQVLTFLLGPFSKLTDRLSAVLRPTEEDLKDPAFFELNTLMTLYVVAGGISALANSDSISRISASNTVDGDIQLGVKDKATVTVRVKDHHFTTIKAPVEHPRAIMEFADLELAHGLFNGTASTINELSKGRIRIAGMVAMLDNMNRILDRISVYLA